MFLISFILHKYEEKVSENESNIDISINTNTDKGSFKSKKNKYLNILFIIIIIIFIEFIQTIISVLIIFKYWMLILLALSYVNVKIFKVKIYIHHKCSIIFNFVILFIFQTTSFILSILSKNKNDKNIYIEYLWFLPIGIIIYLIYIFINSYIYSKIKWFMDKNWISLTKISMLYALVGFFLNILSSV